MQICELADYPTRALVFIGKEHKSLAGTVSEICSHLERENTQFSLLVSDFGLKIFLFPQVNVETLSSSNGVESYNFPSA